MHDVLHGFRAGKGTGTAIMELKLAQELDNIDQDLLFLIFLDLRKAYYAPARDCCLEILVLVGYGIGKRMNRILRIY